MIDFLSVQLVGIETKIIGKKQKTEEITKFDTHYDSEDGCNYITHDIDGMDDRESQYDSSDENESWRRVDKPVKLSEEEKQRINESNRKYIRDRRNKSQKSTKSPKIENKATGIHPELDRNKMGETDALHDE